MSRHRNIENPEREGYPLWLTPVFGCLTILSLGTYVALFGGRHWVAGVAMLLAMGTAGVRIMTYMDAMDRPDRIGDVPNAKVTVALLVVSVLLFWIPVAGLALISYALFRTRWLSVNDWILFPFACVFLLSAVTTLVWGLITTFDRVM